MNKSKRWTFKQNQILINNSDYLSYRQIQEKLLPEFSLDAIKLHARFIKLKKKRYKQYQQYKNCEICNKEFFVTNKRESLRRSCSTQCSWKLRKIKSPIEWFLREKMSRLRTSAKKRNLKFDLNWKILYDIHMKQKGLCFYTGIKMNMTFEKGYKVCHPFQLSVDRIDSSKGYLRDNIVLCCYCINNMKGEFEKDVIKEIFQKIYQNNGEIYGNKIQENT